MKRFTGILLTISMILSIISANVYAAEGKAFTDITDEAYSEAATALQKLEVLEGYPDGTFKAENSITRAEMAAVICRMIGMEDEASSKKGKTKFADVKSDHWASGYINIASEEGIINGDGNGKFRPGDNVKHEEALKMVVCAMGYDKDIEKDPYDWSAPYIEAADEKGITDNLKGMKGDFSTRGDVAVMSYNGLCSSIEAPVVSHKAGSYEGAFAVTLTTPAKNADIYYTTDGSEPGVKSNKYKKAFTISKSCTLKAVTAMGDVIISDVVSVDYKVKYSNGGGGGSSSSKTSKFTVSFDLNYDDATNAPEEQKVKKGNCATEPKAPEREGYKFFGWFTEPDEEDLSKLYDFTTSIKEDTILYAKWIDITDTDGDMLVDGMEEYYGTDKTKPDTDDDGLSDYIETAVLSLDPLKVDTDGNGTGDGDEDYDKDGVANKAEITAGTDPAVKDTDKDGLNDNENAVYKTNPTESDTDKDGVSDGKEIELGTDPLTVQTEFDVKVKAENNDGKATASVQMNLSGNQVETLSVKAVENDTLFPETMPGYMGKAYDFNVEGTFTSAEISFEFDSSKLDADADPVIYYFNESEQVLEELETTVSGNVAKTVVTHFSKYILVNRTVYEKAFTWQDTWESDATFTDVEIVFVIDDSGSMTSNDPSYQRLSVARTLIDNLPENSKIGLVRFDGNYPLTSALTPELTDDKEEVKDFLTNQYFYSPGGTDMYNGIQKGFPLFESDEDTTLKMMIVLSDGQTEDTYMHDSVVSIANSMDVRIYTVGLGSSTSYFNNYLNPLAVNTGGKFYLASNAGQLADIYKDISEKIDIETDSDGDGVPDYYEDNMILFNGEQLPLDKNDPDSDNDGLKDGEELIIVKEVSPDGKSVKVTGKLVLGNPGMKDADGDGLEDPDDAEPFKWNVNGRDLAILSQAIYCRNIPLNVNLDELSDSVASEIDKNFHDTASIKEMKGWKLLYYYRDTTDVKTDETYGGFCYGIFADDHNTVLVYRGSVGNKAQSILDKRGDWYRNFFVYPFENDPDGQNAEIVSAVVVNSYLVTNKDFYITGHSRGGMLAQRGGVGVVSVNKASTLDRLAYYNGMGVVFTKGSLEATLMWNAAASLSGKTDFYTVKGDLVSILGVHPGGKTHEYKVVKCAKDNHDSTAEHFLCNFTAQIMKERYKSK